MDALFIHAPMTLFLAVLFELDWMHTGFIALGWVIKDDHHRLKWTWQAVIAIASTNVVAAIWAGVRRLYILTAASIYILFTLHLASPRVNPHLPNSAAPKPTQLLITLIVCLVLHPVALLAGLAWKRTSEREGRIRLEEEVERAERAEEEAEEEARLEARH